ncbi:MAG: GNAT family N-acetyltransferase [Anaerolineaceae bacterium]|nr:GNAT family N-acetyltransferase [Anaerolineaceae bacterium]
MEKLSDRKKAAGFFTNYKWNYLAKAILDGVHGEVMVDNLSQPNIVVLSLSNINLSIVGGDPSHPAARDFISNLTRRSALLFADHEELWEGLGNEIHGIQFIKTTRYAFTSERLELEHIKKLRDHLPEQYSLNKIDLELVKKIISEKSVFTEDHFSNFASTDEFLKKGYGFVILDGDQVVSIATTFVVCDDGIEIQINTRKKYEGQGLGTVVGAVLIVESLERGLDPNWDAASKTSAHLAKKFGYIEEGEYPMYFIFGPKLLVAFLLGVKKIRDIFKVKKSK